MYKEKGSKFIGFAIPTNSETEFKEELSRIKKDYRDAGHHCYAFRIGTEGKLYRFSDDGNCNITLDLTVVKCDFFLTV